MQGGRSSEEAAVQQNALYDVNRRIEAALRSLGEGRQEWPVVALLLLILFRSLQLGQATGPIVLKRRGHLTAAQLVLYNDGGLVVRDSPTRCYSANEPINDHERQDGETTFLIQDPTYTPVCCSLDQKIMLDALSTGAQLRVTAVEELAIHL
ncbi:hypothetical protein ABL78_8205 [Leptomonas seymouri]|uniref:Uncharacterized protein n=1 Tax=Leptomonas seymouri TaxID=5684 RepID=A0A0N1PAZ6_LEPSE|nr:hypothetical protein ABL78_8205 [Leptomonas seymouri]|eukprot:KPI82780.1 hypothetical protein ABL78_8205 [Leptomonas seymouri]